jgi:hypothetical protein
MSPSRFLMSRLSSTSNPIRPLRVLHRAPNPRPFTQNCQLLRIAPTSARPQLPFLHNTAAIRTSNYLNQNQFQTQLARLLTTERKRYVKDQFRLAAKVTAYFWTALFLLGTIVFGFQNERLERAFPSPSEWSWWSRYRYRIARGEERPESGYVDWVRTGQDYRAVVLRLEDPNIDGKGLEPPLGADGEIYVEGIGKTGFDVSTKSEPWRRGYYECLRGAARAAEYLETWVQDTTRQIAFPSEVVIGPSNPRPRPVPYGAHPAPLEENCLPAYESPEVYYMKILTTKGFSTRQRLDAALAYADWLDSKGLPSSAANMYEWALDIATANLPIGSNNTLNIKTGVIDEKATLITPNILLAATAFATHHAKTGNFSTALPIFLSILRAQRSLPPPSPTRIYQSLSNASDPEPSTLSVLASLISKFIVTPPYPPPPPSGDEPAARTPTTVCEEAGTMSHIGEILFASSSAPSINSAFSPASPTQNTSAQLSGLAWTRSAVELAEKTLLSLNSQSTRSSLRQNTSPTALSKLESSPDIALAQQRCTECLSSGIENWKLMVAKMQALETKGRNESKSLDPTRKAKQGWFWTWGKAAEDGDEGKWEKEAKVVEMKAKELRSLLRQDGWMSGRQEAAGRGAVWGFG